LLYNTKNNEKNIGLKFLYNCTTRTVVQIFFDPIFVDLLLYYIIIKSFIIIKRAIFLEKFDKYSYCFDSTFNG